MTIGLTDYTMERLLNWFLRGTAWAQPNAVYLGLDSVLGDVSGGGAELTQSGYTRPAVTYGAYASRRISNSTALSFTAGENWPEVVGCRIWDAPSGGNALAWGRATPRPTILSGQTYQIAPGEHSISGLAAGKVGNWFLQRMLEKAFKNQSHASLSGSLKAHLALVGPANDGTGYTMVSGSGYSPQTATVNAWASGRCYLSSDITYSANAPAAWGEAAEWDLYDGADPASDHFLFGCPLSPTMDIGLGAVVVLRAADSYVYLAADTVG